MNVLKAIKSFFTIADESKTPLSRKMKHASRPAVLETPEEKENTRLSNLEYERDANRIYNDLRVLATEGADKDAVAFIKSKQISTTPLTENEIRYIALNCDFVLDNNLEPDPRLVAAINFAVNLHAIKVKDMITEKVDDIVKMVDKHAQETEVK